MAAETGTAGSKRERQRKPKTKVADKVACCKGATHGCRSASHTANGVSDVDRMQVVCREMSSARSPDPAALQILGWLPAMPRSEAGGGGGSGRYC